MSFVNPYTFIPVDKCIRDQYANYYNDQVFSGKINCTLITKTELCIPDLKIKENEEGYALDETDKDEPGKYPFFSVQGKPVIPGSSIRGVIKSSFEVLTDSCLHINDEADDYFTSRCNKNKTGLLAWENGEYVLYQAQRCRDKKKLLVSEKTGDKVRIKKRIVPRSPYPIITELSADGEEGYVLKVAKLNKNHDSVFIKQESDDSDDSVNSVNKNYEILEAAIERLERNIFLYSPPDPQRTDVNVKNDYQACFEAMKKGEGLLPVWYWIDESTEEKFIYFSPSQMSRSVYHKKPRDLIEQIGVQSCSNTNEICSACALFGFIASGNNNVKQEGSMLASRLRFGDAVCNSPEQFGQYYELPILATPHLSSFEFYLRNDNKTNSYSPDNAETTIAGRKFYWHHRAGFKKYINPDLNKNMPTKNQVVKENSQFEFKIYFDQITEKQLAQLLVTLNLGDNSLEGNFCHKIGHGKPIGFGSVKIQVDSVIMRSYENHIYTESPYDISNSLAKASLNRNNLAKLFRVANWQAVKEDVKVCYPALDVNGNIFEWFAANRISNKGKSKSGFFVGNPKYNKKLVDLELGKIIEPDLSSLGVETRKIGKQESSSIKPTISELSMIIEERYVIIKEIDHKQHRLIIDADGYGTKGYVKETDPHSGKGGLKNKKLLQYVEQNQLEEIKVKPILNEDGTAFRTTYYAILPEE